MQSSTETSYYPVMRDKYYKYEKRILCCWRVQEAIATTAMLGSVTVQLLWQERVPFMEEDVKIMRFV
jgi:hypothetical protein